MVDLKVKLGDLTLDNPIIPASGTFGFGEVFEPLYDISRLGSIALKGTTLNERYGNELPRIAECPAGMINAVGLENPGVNSVIHDKLLHLEKVFKKPLIANISGFSIDEYKEVARDFDEVDSIGILEINISCPNVHGGGMAFGLDPKMAAEVTKAVKEVTHKPVYIKLSPNGGSTVEVAKAVEEAGADGISMINTLVGMRVDLRTRKPVLSTIKGGYSGPGIYPVALAMVYDVYEAVDIPIIGMGGIRSARNVLEMMMVGASAVQIGASNLVNPRACIDILDDLPQTMEMLGISSLEDIVGTAHV